ncbi:hypothetical protein SADUNF_Sadunf02G0035600 [Salix dunnii]|uniref:Carbohydrate kinase PfkB domain-containing protein n=1 Tax=Salix dunnii TaxID=1413687 RepID=A0A835TG20_9ROSI|nr:hypothetical protein SADUNF_Sadunf02G0035600 [Salix dunnii]
MVGIRICQAESLTGIRNPILAGKELLKKGIRTKWVMGSRGSIPFTLSSIYILCTCIQVNVIDTVGRGDSFVAAIAFGYIHNMPLVYTLVIANATGAATAMGCGAGRNVSILDKVTELMRASDITEDDEFWSELGRDLDAEEITILSKLVINGRKIQANHIALQKVVSELLLPMLKNIRLEGKVASRWMR